MNEHLTKDGQKFIIRTPVENDAEAIIHYSKILFASTDQVLTMPEEYTIGTLLSWARQNDRHIRAIKQPSGEYIDVIQMYKETK